MLSTPSGAWVHTPKNSLIGAKLPVEYAVAEIDLYELRGDRVQVDDNVVGIALADELPERRRRSALRVQLRRIPVHSGDEAETAAKTAGKGAPAQFCVTLPPPTRHVPVMLTPCVPPETYSGERLDELANDPVGGTLSVSVSVPDCAPERFAVAEPGANGSDAWLPPLHPATSAPMRITPVAIHLDANDRALSTCVGDPSGSPES